MAAPAKAKFMLVTNNEIFRIETACLNRFQADPLSLNIATVTGGADTTLTALMHPSVGNVVTFDPSPLQIHLLRLKLAVAMSDLTADQAVGFLLRGEGGSKVFTSSLKDKLPKETVEFFESAGSDEIEQGVLRADNDGVFNKMLRKWFVDEHGINLGSWHTMDMATKDKVLDVCATNDGATLTVMIQTFFKGAPWFKALPEESQAFILSALGIAAVSTLKGTGMILRDTDVGLLPSGEFHTDIVLTASTKTLPPWLTAYGRAVLKKKKADTLLETMLIKAEDLKPSEAEKFAFISLSNIYDFSPEEKAVASLKGVAAAALKPGGEILMRRAVGNADGIMKAAGGKVPAGEALESVDYNSLFYRIQARWRQRHSPRPSCRPPR